MSLHDGYGAYLREQTARQADRSQEIERGLRTRHNREKLLSPFCRAVKQYELIQPGDRIAVCISGGKDSMLMAKLFQELKRQNRMPFELTFLCMDPGYNDLNRSPDHIRVGHLRRGLRDQGFPLLPLRPHAAGPPLRQGQRAGL